MPRNTIKQRANKRRNANRVWNSLVAKLSSKTTEQPTIPTIFYEEDAEDRYERHMKPIRMASNNRIVAKQSHTTVILPASIRGK